MKTLLASIIIGLLSLSPAFAQSPTDTKQKETDQNRYSEQAGEQRQVLPKSDQDRQVKETDQKRQPGQDGMPGHMDKQHMETDQKRQPGQDGMPGRMDKQHMETDQNRQPGQDGMPGHMDRKHMETDQNRQPGQDGMPGRQGATDPARSHRATEVEPQEGFQRVSSDLITADDLQGASVYGSNNESMADVDEVLITPEGKVERIIVNVGGFLGMGSRSVAIDVNEADIHKDANDDLRVYIPMSEEELRQMPEYKKDN